MKNDNGFTLVELVVTILIIGILAVTAAPRFFNILTYQERGFYDETIAALRYAQKYTEASGCTIRAEIMNNGYRLWRAAAVGTCNTAPFDTPLNSPVRTGQPFANTVPASSGIVLVLAPAQPGNSILFAPPGTASADVTVTVGTRPPINIVAATGFIRK